MGTQRPDLQALLSPVVAALGCEIWGLEYSSSTGQQGTLRLYIDKPGGVALDDCERVSRQVSAILDVEDPIGGEYRLEVSSPGLDRPLYRLDHYRRFVGEEISLKLRAPHEGRRNFKGQLRGVEEDEVVVRVADHEYLFPIASIERANIIPRL